MPPLMIGFTLALLCALLLTHVVRGWGLRAGWVDRPDGHRRAHAGAVPRVGGIAIYITVLLVLAGGVYVRAVDLDALEPGYVPAFLIGGAAIFLMGLWDDTRGLPARTKFLFEIAVALAVFWAGIRVVGFGLPSGGSVYFPFWFSILTTVIWIVGITNAFNLIDGTDGLAAGAALFASTSLGLVSLISQNALGAAVALVLTGATLGFLFYNFPPASIYLGDSGSLFLGFTLAVLGLVTTQTSPTALAVAIPVVSFGLPILDTVLAIARRFLRGERMFSPDRGHIHHRLLDLGHSPRQVALMLYAACAGFALLSILLISPAEPTVAAIFIVSGAIVWLAVQRLHIPELLELGRVLHRGRYQRLAIASNVRIREAVRRLEVAHDGEAVVSAATHAF